MPFTVAQSTLESLEWARVIDELRASCRTPQGALRIAAPEASLASGAPGASDTSDANDPVPPLFESDEESVRARLRETTEARALHDQGIPAPFSGCRDLEAALGHAEKGGVLESSTLLDVRSTVAALDATRHFFDRRDSDCPALFDLAEGVLPIPELEARIARCLDEGGEVRDTASRTLATARREVHTLSSDLKQRIERTLAQPDIAPHLSDHFYTVRNGRFVLPVKADAKGRVRGIVHDASRSGTTLFVEPDGMVEINNRLREAELTVEREVLRVLRELSTEVAREAPRIRDGLLCVGRLDLAFARGQLSRDMDAVEPRVETEGIFELPGLRHPLIPAAECVANDLRVGADFRVLILSGPNAGGKTVALKSMALAALLVRAGLHVPADPGARVDLVDCVLADIGDHQDIRESLSTFSAAMANLARILRQAGPNTFVCLDEVGVGTDPSEGAAIAQATLEALADSGARAVTTTHYNLLKEMAELDERFENASVEFDPETLAPTYRVRLGAPGASSATTVAARMGMPESVLERAAGLLDREDRRLDQMLTELAASRALLESEKAAAETLRLEGEQAREEYRTKLARLQERRDKLFGEMRSELDDSFRNAHGEVARIIRELQRQPSSRKAASAREKLESLHRETTETQVEAGLAPEPAASQPTAPPIDWPKARVGDAVLAPGGGMGTLLSLPDRRGRVSVRVGTAKLSVSRDQLASAPVSSQPSASARAASRSQRPQSNDDLPTTPLGVGGTLETDLRGLRVDEALERLDHALDLAAAQGRDDVRVIHGVGTGALRAAVREHLPHSPYVVECIEAAREEGGPGATRAILRKE